MELWKFDQKKVDAKHLYVLLLVSLLLEPYASWKTCLIPSIRVTSLLF